MWEPLEHTADAGVRLRAPTVISLFEEGARAVTDAIVDVATVRSLVVVPVEIEGIDRDDLLVRFLGEVVYLYDARRFLTAAARIERLDDRVCRAELLGEPFDAARHEVKTEVKAVTYHAAGIREEPGGFAADVIFDL